jgi:hypothetical protein
MSAMTVTVTIAGSVIGTWPVLVQISAVEGFAAFDLAAK